METFDAAEQWDARPIGVAAVSPDQNDFDAIAADDRRPSDA